MWHVVAKLAVWCCPPVLVARDDEKGVSRDVLKTSALICPAKRHRRVKPRSAAREPQTRRCGFYAALAVDRRLLPCADAHIESAGHVRHGVRRDADHARAARGSEPAAAHDARLCLWF
jgi:hypothetical protein